MIFKGKNHPLVTAAKPIAKELAALNDSFGSLQGSNRLLNIVLRYIARGKGKQMRPILVLLSAGMHGEINEKTYEAARLVELIHTATLLHDDVLDTADTRRHLLSVNKIWKNKIAILLGDYLLSTSLLQCTEKKNYAFLEIIATVVKDMVAGEVFQMEKARRLNVSDTEYFEVIGQKTSSLLSACCKMGALSAARDAAPEALERMVLLGGQLGKIFQIKDDILDYKGHLAGKNQQADLKNRVLNLPLLCALQKCGEREQKRYLRAIRNRSKKPATHRAIAKLVSEKKGIQEAETTMQRAKEESLNILRPLPPSAYKSSFIELIDYLVTRTR